MSDMALNIIETSPLLTQLLPKTIDLPLQKVTRLYIVPHTH